LLSDEKQKIIVEFGCGSGNIGLALAYLFPLHEFVLIDFKAQCIKIANERVAINELKNVKLIEGNIEDFDDYFDIGIAVHACGAATDYAQIKCFQHKADFILCSCCVGKINNQREEKDEEKGIDFPRSSIFQKQISRNEFGELSRIADHSQTDFNEKSNERNLCKTVLELDRIYAAMETKLYQTIVLTKVMPFDEKDCTSTSPKNDIICGVNSKSIKDLFVDKLCFFK